MKKTSLQIQAFSSGERINLADEDPEKLALLNPSLQPSPQFDLLLAHLSALTGIVNRNAACLRDLELKSSLVSPAENYLQESLINFTEAVNGLDKESFSNLLAAVSVTNFQGGAAKTGEDLWAMLLSKHKKSVKNFVGCMNFLGSKKNVADEMKDIVDKSGSFDLKAVEKLMENFNSSVNQKINSIEQKLAEVLQREDQKSAVVHEVEKPSQNTTAPLATIPPELAKQISLNNNSINKLNSDLDNFATRFSEVEDKVAKMKSQMDYEMSNPRPTNSQTNRSNFEKELSEIEKQLSTQNNAFATKLEELEGSMNRQLIQFSRELSRMKQPAQGYQADQEPSADFSSNDKVKFEIDSLMAELERSMSKKIISIETRLKEFDDLRKYDKILTKIQIDLNSKLAKETYELDICNKLGRNEFFDFVNKNLISRDQLKTLDFKIEKFFKEFTEKIGAIDGYTRKSKRTLNKKSDDLEKIVNAISKAFEESKQKQIENSSFCSQLGNRMSLVETKINDLKTHVVEVFTARLKSLATTKTLNCLSCGKKDVNYPPLTEYVKGATNYFYIKDGEKNPSTAKKENIDSSRENAQKIQEENKAPNEKNRSDSNDTLSKTQQKGANLILFKPENNRIFSANSNGFSRLSSAKPAHGNLPKRLYSAAEQVITKDIIVEEHDKNLHEKVDDKKRVRPFSSVMQKPLFRIN